MPDGSSRNPFTAADQLTLSDVSERLESDEHLSLQRRRNLCSSIRALGKMVRRELRYLSAHPKFFREFLKDLHPEHCGLSRSRIHNVKSDILFSLRHTGCIDSARTYMAPLRAEWQGFWDATSAIGQISRYVSRFMHFCSAQGISPREVDDVVAERFLRALIDESFVKDPKGTHRNILRT